MKRLLPTAVLAAALANPAFAQSPDRLAALEARMQALEAEAARMRAEAEQAQAELAAARAEIEALKQAQVAAAPAPVDEAAPADETAPAPVAETASASGNANAFNPAISIVLNGTYAHHSLDPEEYFRAGFPLVGHGEPLPQGLSLGESELIVSANVDDKFYGQLTLAVENEEGEDHVGVEEAYVETTSLPNGLQLRAGRFLSNLGYLNSRHAHTDRFTDRPLAYQALLGNHYGDDGVQLRWVAPTDTFIELGAELMRGEAFPFAGAVADGVGVRTLFLHAGGSVGEQSEWLAGVSAVDARSDGEDGGFDGDTRLYALDATWKWAPRGNFKDGGVTLRGEYLVEHRDGIYTLPEDPGYSLPWDARRAGAYLEAIWRINRRWETGYRYDRLWSGDDSPFAIDHDPSRHSLMLAWMNSEFSLLRVQYAHDRANPVDSDDVLSLQYQVNFGAHGAHRF
jgi:hypothetical protein